MSALAAEQTCYDYNELIEIIYISWHHSSSRHTICGTWGYAPSKVDMSQDNIHVASHYALLRKGSYWPPPTQTVIRQRLLWDWPDGLEWSPGCDASDVSGPLCSISIYIKYRVVNSGSAALPLL